MLFEHELYEITPPNALVSANTNKLVCPLVEKVQFKNYSVIRNASSAWQWIFARGTPQHLLMKTQKLNIQTQE